jgi:hypothetical protein
MIRNKALVFLAGMAISGVAFAAEGKLSPSDSAGQR